MKNYLESDQSSTDDEDFDIQKEVQLQIQKKKPYIQDLLGLSEMREAKNNLKKERMLSADEKRIKRDIFIQRLRSFRGTNFSPDDRKALELFYHVDQIPSKAFVRSKPQEYNPMISEATVVKVYTKVVNTYNQYLK